MGEKRRKGVDILVGIHVQKHRHEERERERLLELYEEGSGQHERPRNMGGDNGIEEVAFNFTTTQQPRKLEY